MQSLYRINLFAWARPVCWFLWPFSLLYQLIFMLRSKILKLYFRQSFEVPVIVVGNLTVGGVGKTPLVMALTAHFKARQLKVGIVSRGYRAKIKQFPYEVNIHDSADLVGDEPLLLAQKTHVPVVIARKRCQAIEYLLQKYSCQIIISDDGLQHTAMGRALEIVVIDGCNGFGNGFCLPAGPLREPISRLKSVDFIFIHGDNNTNIVLDSILAHKYRMDLGVKYLLHLTSGVRIAPGVNLPEPIAALAGIGRPERFFDSLRALGYVFNAYSFPDHYAFISSDLNFTEKTVLMTEKDAVKCSAFLTDAMYALSVEAKICSAFWSILDTHPKLKRNL